jgi:hypothetical protein
MVIQESSHRFIDPVRYFKENDPYYWEVDNIPLKQLQENCLWLKDQLEISLKSTSDRGIFTELQPFATGNDNIVKVRKGRFTARINDAYSLNPLQKIKALSTSAYEISKFQIDPQNLITPDQLINELSNFVSVSSYNFNGLVERALSWPTDKNVTASNVTGFAAYDDFNTESLPRFTPGIGNWPLLQNMPFLDEFVQGNDPTALQQLATEFCRRFRGVARTAVVDVPEDLEIQIPDFNQSDFGYYDENNNFILFENPAVRIDLLFIYSKPIDSNQTAIQSYLPNQNIKTITKPTLGLVKGAGVFLSKSALSNGVASLNSIDSDGNSQILPQIADSNISTNGFQNLNVHGSFPSPDDLMNLAPLISEKLQQNDPRLIGQTILPVAYVVVRSNQIVGSEGIPVINAADVIDIRPFFRTTELTYSERSGLAAAIPSPSLANPVTTKFNLEQAAASLKNYSEATYEKKGKFYNHPKTVAAGYILGGTSYGPEKPPLNTEALVSLSEGPIPGLPQWDKAVRLGQAPAAEWFDWLDVTNSINNPDLGSFGSIPEYNSAIRNGLVLVQYRKKIRVTGVAQRFPNLTDYYVKLNYFNCAPITGNGADRTFGFDEGVYNQVSDHCVNGLYAIKQPLSPNGDIEFTIMCVTSTNRATIASTNENRFQRFFILGDNPVLVNYRPDAPGPQGSDTRIGSYGICAYPSISFEVVGLANGAKMKYNWVDSDGFPTNEIDAYGDFSSA